MGVGISPMIRWVFGCVAIHYKVMTMQKAVGLVVPRYMKRKEQEMYREQLWTDDDDE